MQCGCAIVCILWSVWLYHIFPHYLINGTIFGRKVIEHNMCVFIFSTILYETFFITRRIQRDIAINLRRSLCKVLDIRVRF